MTGLEPATSGVTGRHSNQLSYTRVRPDKSLFRPEVRLDYGFQFSKSSAEKADRKKYKTPIGRAKLSFAVSGGAANELRYQSAGFSP